MPPPPLEHEDPEILASLIAGCRAVYADINGHDRDEFTLKYVYMTKENARRTAETLHFEEPFRVSSISPALYVDRRQYNWFVAVPDRLPVKQWGHVTLVTWGQSSRSSPPSISPRTMV